MTINTQKRVLASEAVRDYALPSGSFGALELREPTVEYDPRKRDGWGNIIASDREVKTAAAQIFAKYRGAFVRLADM